MHKGKEIFQIIENLYLSIFYLFYNCKGTAVTMSMILKTGQGSLSDPLGNTHSTACVHMAKLSPLHPPTQHGFIHTAHRERVTGPC